MPITEAIYRVLYEGLPPLEAMARLMARPRAHELEEVAEVEGPIG